MRVTSFTVASTVFPGTTISDVELRLTAPSVVAAEAEPAYTIDAAGLRGARRRPSARRR